MEEIQIIGEYEKFVTKSESERKRLSSRFRYADDTNIGLK
jgi:hypothetical protein